MDYGVVLSAFFWRRFKNKEQITFFDPNEVPDLYEAFYSNTERFEQLYCEYENLLENSKNLENLKKDNIVAKKRITWTAWVFLDRHLQQI